MIQHRQIQNTELHEVKGADTAIAGMVLTADGLGNTFFDRIGVGQLKGSLPTTVPDLALVTDGAGGFKASAGRYGQFKSTFNPAGGGVWTTVASITPKGMYINASGVSVSTTGLYYVASTSISFVPPSDLVTPFFIDTADPVTPLLPGLTGIVQLTAGPIYRVDSPGSFTIMGVQ